MQLKNSLRSLSPRLLKLEHPIITLGKANILTIEVKESILYGQVTNVNCRYYFGLIFSKAYFSPQSLLSLCTERVGKNLGKTEPSYATS